MWYAYGVKIENSLAFPRHRRGELVCVDTGSGPWLRARVVAVTRTSAMHTLCYPGSEWVVQVDIRFCEWPGWVHRVWYPAERVLRVPPFGALDE